MVRATEWSESSQVVSLLTREHGLVRGLAKGAQRFSPSLVQRYSGGFELLTRGEAVGMLRGATQLTTLTEWDLQASFTHLRRDLDAMRVGLYAADLVNALVPEREPHTACFDVLLDLLAVNGDAAAREAALLRFQWVTLVDCGYRPQVDTDARHDRPLPVRDAYTFDATAGGLTGDDVDAMATSQRGPWRVRASTVDLLRAVDRGDAVDASFDALRRANRLLCVYVRALIDRELPTMRVVLGSSDDV